LASNATCGPGKANWVKQEGWEGTLREKKGHTEGPRSRERKSELFFAKCRRASTEPDRRRRNEIRSIKKKNDNQSRGGRFPKASTGK